MKMSDNRVAQLIQQLDDAIMMGDDDLIEQIRSDLFREYGIEKSGRAEMGLGGLIGKAIGNAVNTMIKQKRSPIGRARGSQSTQSKFYDDFDDVVRDVDDPRLDKQQQDIIEQMIEMGEMDPFANGGRVGLREGGISDLMFEALGSDATSNYAKLQMLDALTNFAGSDALFNALGPLIGFRDGGNVGIMSALR